MDVVGSTRKAQKPGRVSAVAVESYSISNLSSCFAYYLVILFLSMCVCNKQCFLMTFLSLQ